MKKKLIITLKSDLCVASGYSYAGVVDSDICYDKYGLPYIPSRRLKGCFRDTAENVLYSLIQKEQVKDLFGIRGADIGGSLRISNAKLHNYDEIKKELIALKENPEVCSIFSQQKVLNQYTHIVAQTAIGEDSSAEDKSLRYTRVVNHYIPELNSNEYTETVFEAVIEYAEDWATEMKEGPGIGSLNTTQALKLIVGATKNIGLKRNRGFGAVACKISDMSDGEEPKKNTDDFIQNMEYVISYNLTNDEPLMLSQLSDTHSEQYISGQTILGYLAGAYLKRMGMTAESKEFKDLFLNGTTKYVNAYPAVVDSNGKVCIYYPAPANINRLKKTKEYVDTYYYSASKNEKSDHESKDKNTGNQPKKLKKKFLFQDISDTTIKIDVKEVDMKLHYHHRKGEDGILYPSEAIEPDQIFTGEIYTYGKYVKTLIEMLKDQDFYFGKSKTAQYGHCKCEVVPVNPVNEMKKRQYKGEILVTLLTDAIFYDAAEYTVKADTIADQICKSIDKAIADQICKSIDKATADQICKSIDKATADVKRIKMETGLASGYQTTWNMHKPLYPVVKAGSCFVLSCKNKVDIPDKIWVGTRNQEGYGYASVIAMKERKIEPLKPEMNKKTEEVQISDFKPQYCNILKAELLEALLLKSINLKGITKTQISRAILMLKQSKNFDDFKMRINSIKTDSVRTTFNEKLVEPFDDKNEANFNLGKLIKDASEAKKYCCLLQNEKVDLSGLWRDYLLYNLILCKYEAKEV